MERLLVCFSLLVLLQTSLAARLHHEHRHVIRTDGSSSVGTAQGHQFHTDVEQSIEDTVESMASDKLFSSADAEALADAITRKLQQEDEYPYKKEDWLRLAQMVFEEAEDRLTAPHYVKEVAARVVQRIAERKAAGDEEVMDELLKTTASHPLDGALQRHFRHNHAENSIVGANLIRWYGTKLLIMALKNDELIGHQILDRGGVWDGMALGIMLDYLHQGVNVVDAGANIGSYTVYYAYKIGNNASVYAFEPQNLVYQVMCANLVVNGYTNVHAYHAALSYKKEELKQSGSVQQGAAKGASLSDVTSSGQKADLTNMALADDGEIVFAYDLDSFNLDKVGYFKVDVNGAEPFVIYGARETIKRNLPVVVVELDKERISTFKSGWARSHQVPAEVMQFDVHTYLSSLKYELARNVDKHAIYLPPGFVMPRRRLGEQQAGQAGEEEHEQPQVEKLY